MVKNPPANAGNKRDAGSILSQKDPLEKEMATHSRPKEPGGLQSAGMQRVGYE